MADNIETGHLQAKISVDDSDVNKSLADLQRDVRVAGSEFKKASVEIDNFGKGTDGLKAKADALSKQIEAQMRLVSKLREEYTKSVQNKGADARETQNLEIRMNNASTALAKMQNDLKATTDELNKQTTAWQRVGKRLDEFTDKTKKFGQNAARVGRDLTVAITTPLAIVGGLAFKAANDIDQAMATIVTSTGATGEALKGLEDDFKEVYSSIPTSADAASGAIANLNTLLGASGPVLQQLSKNILEVSRMMGEDGVANSHAFGQAMQQWEVPADQAVGVMDELFKITQDTGIGFGELVKSLNTYGPVMKNAGFSTQETAELMGRMNAAGIAWSRISPGLNKSFRDWAAAGKEPRVELERTFVAMQNAQTEAEALNIAVGVFGSDGAQRLTTGVRQGALSLEGLGDALQGVDGLIADTSEQTMTFADEMRMLKNEVEANIAPIGSSLIKALKDVLTLAQPMIDGIGRMAEGFSELDESTQKSIITWGLVVAAIGPAILVVGKFTTAIGATITAVKSLSTVLTFLATNPYALGLIALSSAVASVAISMRNTRKATDELREAQEELQRVQREGIERHEIEMYEQKIESLEELKQQYLDVIEIMKSKDLEPAFDDLSIAKVNLALKDAAKEAGISLDEFYEKTRKAGINASFFAEGHVAAAVSLNSFNKVIDETTKLITDARRETTAELNEMARKIAMQINEIKTTEELIKVYRTAKEDTDEWKQAQAELASMFPQFTSELGLNADAIEGLMIVKRQEIELAWQGIQVKAEEIKMIKEEAAAKVQADLYDMGMSNYYEEEYQKRLTRLREINAEIAALNALISGEMPAITSRVTTTIESIEEEKEKSKPASAYSNEELEQAYRDLEHKKRLDQLTIEQEIATLERIKEAYVRTADERMTIEEKLYDARKRSAQMSKDNEKAMLDEAARQYKIALDDKLIREELSAEQQFNAQKKYYDNVIELNKEHLERVLANDRYSAEEKQRIQEQITEVIRKNTNDRMQLQKNYYAEIERQEIESINKLSQGVQAALRARYQDERDKRNDELKEATDANELWRKTMIDDAQSVYDKKTKLAQQSADAEIAELNRVLGAQIQAIQDELNALDQAEKQRTREELDAEDEKKLARLQASLEYERDEHNKTQLQREINRIMAERDERHRKEQLEDHKDALKEEERTLRDTLREETDLIRQQLATKKEMLREELDAEIDNANLIYEITKSNIEKEVKATKEKYDDLLTARAIQSQAEKMIIENQHHEILKLMEDFGDDYQLAGQTLGDKVAEGFQIGIDHISQLIADLHAQINAARSAAISAMQDAARASNAASTSTVNNNNNAKNVTVNNTFTSPVTSPSDVSRASRKAVQDMALQL